MLDDAKTALARSLPLSKRGRTMFTQNTAALNATASKALTEYHRLQASKRLAAQRLPAFVVEHIPAERIEVSPQRAAELTEREWCGGTQTNRLTGEVSHLVRRRVGDAFVTERVEGAAP